MSRIYLRTILIQSVVTYTLSIISRGEFNSDWSRSSVYDAIYTALGGEYSISRFGC